MRRALAFPAAVLVVLVAAVGAWAYVTSGGAGTGSLLAASLGAPAPQGVTAPSGMPRISWTAVRLSPSNPSLDAEVADHVARRVDGGSTWLAAAGACSGALPAATLTCDDDPPTGSYEYRVTATLRSWSSAATTGTVSTLNTTSLGLTAPASGTSGVAVPASALASSLTGATSAPAAGGTITVSWFGPQASAPASCQVSGAGWTQLGTAAATGGGTYNPASGSFTPRTPGTYWWYATYEGDTLNSASASTCGAVSTVVTNVTSLSVAAPAAGTVGTAIAAADVTASLSGAADPAPLGAALTLSWFGPQATPPATCRVAGAGWTTLGLMLSGGNGSYAAAAADVTPTAPGTYWWFASYSGDTLDDASTSACGADMASTAVQRAQPALAVSLDGSPPSGTAGTPVPAASITAALTGRVLQDGAGGVAFFYVEQDDAPAGCTGGTAIGGAVAESAASDYHPNGPFTPPTAGTYWLYAVYSGDANNLDAGSCPAQKLEVAKAQPSLSLAVSGSATAGTAFPAASITATLDGRVSQDDLGTVSFFYLEGATPPAACSGGTAIGSVTESAASDSHPGADFTPTTAGTYWLYAVYSGDANNLDAASCPAQKLVVAKGQPSLSLSVSGGITATLDGRVSQDGSGTVAFFSVAQTDAPADCTGGTEIGSGVTESDTTTYTIPFAPSAGTYWLYAVYSGDGNNLDAGTCPAQKLVVAKAQPTLSLSVAGGITATLSDRVGQDGTGTVAFFSVQQTDPPGVCTGGIAIGSPVTESGSTTYQPSLPFAPAPGAYWLYAVYSGDANNLDAGTCPAQKLVVPPAAP